MHGYRNPMRFKVRTSKCLSCEVNFSSIQKVFRHVAYVSERCKQFYSDNILDMSIDEFQKLAECNYYDDKSKTAARKFVCPAFKVNEDM